jgi:DNA (cytosine-5)-methyltransferase 1
MELVPHALNKIGLRGQFQMAFACDSYRPCRKLIRQCHRNGTKPKTILKDIVKRRSAALPDHDVYIAGFPCQPFSVMGAHEGLHDSQGRGKIIFLIIKASAQKRPRAFLLENVKGLVTCHPEALRMILQRLRAIGGGLYEVGHRVLDTAQHGLPQHRERVFIVGLRKRHSHHVPKFRWPRPVPCCPLASMLDPLPATFDVQEAERNFLATCTPGNRRRLLDAFSTIEAAGLDRHSNDNVVVVDLDGSKAHWMRGVSPCLTRSRAAVGFYLPARGRRMTLPERLRLQGIPQEVLKSRRGISDRQLGMMVGNALSVNVLERLLVRILRASGLRMHLRDRGARK